MKHPTKLAFLFLVAIMLTACGNSASSQGSRQNSRQFSMSWAEAYPTIAEMTKNADAIVLGTTEEVTGTTQKDGLPYTDFRYHVEQWIMGVSAGERIQIHQTGGSMNGQSMEAEDDPLLVPGEHSLLFLRNYAPGKYKIMGGPTGRLLDKGGRVTALPGGAARDGLPAGVTAFTSRIRALALSYGKS